MDNNLIGISVVIPFYNGNRYIGETVKSLVASLQLAKVDYEILIINDSPGIDVDSSVAGIARVTVYKNPANMGIAGSRNRGKALARFEYIYFIDQDDWVDLDFFTEAFKYLKAGYKALIFNFRTVRNGVAIKRYNIFFKHIFPHMTPKHLFKYGSFFKSIGQAVFTRELMGDFIETGTMGSDDSYKILDLFVERDKHRPGYVHKPLFYYRMHDDNYSDRTDFRKSATEGFEKYIEKHPEIEECGKYMFRRYEGDVLLNVVAKLVRVALMANLSRKRIRD